MVAIYLGDLDLEQNEDACVSVLTLIEGVQKRPKIYMESECSREDSKRRSAQSETRCQPEGDVAVM